MTYLQFIILGFYSWLVEISSLQAMDGSEIHDLHQGQGPEYIEKLEPFVTGTSRLKYTFCYQPQQASLPKDNGQQEELPSTPYVVQDGLVAKVTTEEPELSKQSSSSPSDNRDQVKTPSQWPHCVHGHLMMRLGTGEITVGSGILVGPNHVLTAGHNLYNLNKKQWVNEVWFSPGRQGKNFPFGYVKGGTLLCPKEWTTNSRQKDDYDFGMVILEQAIGNKTGWSGLLYAPDIYFDHWSVTVTGYPGEKGSKDYYSTQMWEKESRAKAQWFGPERIEYDIPTSFGQSGGAIWRQWPSSINQTSIFTIGIHTDGSLSGKNKGVRFTQQKFSRIVNWIKTYHLREAVEYRILEPKLVKMKELSTADDWWNKGNTYFQNQKYQKAFTCFYNAVSKAGDKAPDLMLLSLADCYRKEKGIQKNYLEAFNLYMQIENPQNCAESMCHIGKFYLNGLGVPLDIVSGLHFLEESAKQDNIKAIYELYRLYSPDGKYPNLEKAKRYRDKAQALGKPILDLQFLETHNPDTRLRTNINSQEKGKEKEIDERNPLKTSIQLVECLKKAAEKGDVSALFNLGLMYAEGRAGLPPGEQAYQQAMKWYMRAAEKGFPEALLNLGLMYAEGRTGLPQGEQADQQAVKWFKKAAEKGNITALFDIGWMYAEGRAGLPPGEQADQEAMKWYKRAAEKGDASALLNLGLMCTEGRAGLPQGEQVDQQAVEWFKKAAEKGDITALFDIGLMYAEGRAGLPPGEQADQEAMKWYKEAAEKGNASALLNLGLMYAEGRAGLPPGEQADQQAVKWFKKAAEKGNITAQVNLDLMYAKGRVGLHHEE
ncbi:trypsin-like serine protease [Candidatus Paracaedibacter symbiosus]|uniref:trypsin-like serine protease n=1 Tax=Candidatus Paracaedibacter symbiosus TaxID=244582 RepID=UPI00069070C9|nr:trypsin-like serine protease [Candidatus Paracaedibacter symbiosus]